MKVADFGIRGMDLAYELQEDYDAAILVDAVPRGEPPGTLFVIEPDLDEAASRALDAHGMDPVRVLGLARALGALPPRVLVVGCEPAMLDDAGRRGARDGAEPSRARRRRDAVELVESVLEDRCRQDNQGGRVMSKRSLIAAGAASASARGWPRARRRRSSGT